MPHINIVIGGKKTIALIDSGAQASLISAQFLEDNRVSIGSLRPTKAINIVTATRKRIATVNKIITCEIRIGEVTCVSEFLVLPGLQKDCIIGIDILKKCNVIINVRDELVQFNGENIPWVAETDVIDETVEHCINNIIIKNANDIRDLDINCDKNHLAFVRTILEKNLELINDIPTLARGYEHKLQVDETVSLRVKNYPIPYLFQNQVNSEIMKMLKDGIIEKSTTNYINPLVIVKKKDNQIRLCLDARKLNNITKPQFETPLTIETLVVRCGKASIYSRLDLQSSFWLIPLENASKKYCGFIVDGHVYQFRVVPFGLSSSSAALVRAMQNILDPYSDFCSHYVDDILIYSKNVDEHEKHVSKILYILRENGLKINIQKCEFFKNKIKYLGYELGEQKVNVEMDRLDIIKNYPRPKNLRMLRGFLGLINYYKRFIPNLAEKNVILYEMLKKHVKFKWTEERIEAFENVKSVFYKKLSLIIPDFSKQFILRTDASNTAIAGELLQINNDEEEPIGFVSRILKKFERNYTISEKEMLSIVFSLEKFRYYLLGKNFEIQTDHIALTSLMNTRFANNRIYRWSLLVQEFQFKIKYRKGSENVVADALSRCHIRNKPSNSIEVNYYDLDNAQGIYAIDNIRRMQNHEVFNNIKENLREKQSYKGFKWDNGILVKKIGEENLILTSKEFAEQVIDDVHERYGHVGIRKTWLIFRETFYVIKGLSIVKDKLQKCELCLLGKDKNCKRQYRIQSTIVENKLDLVAIDFLGNLIPGTRGMKNVFVMVDVFSKFVKLYPTRKYDTDTALNCIRDFITNVGKMDKILADNASYFSNERFINELRNLEVNISFTSIRHPQTNMAERYIQEVIKYLRMLTHRRHDAWVRYIPQVEEYLNNTPSTVTEISPITIITGIKASRPWNLQPQQVDDINLLMENCRRKIRQQAQRYVTKQNELIRKRTLFNIGDYVIIKRYRLGRRQQGKCAKLDLPYAGPYRITRIFNEVTYELETLNGRVIGRYHINMIHPYTAQLVQGGH